jgi:hypothetical protein
MGSLNGILVPDGTIRSLIGYDLKWEDKPVMYSKSYYSLTFYTLSRKFPKFVFRYGTSEIIGYNFKKSIHMVIEDGNCSTTDGKWLVHQYKIRNPKSFNWLEWKYILDNKIAEKILEEWVDFMY